MRNLNESRREPREQEVVPFERRGTMLQETTTASMIPTRQAQELRERWTAVQSHFVDEPHKAVEEADELVAAAIKQIEECFAAERSNLEKQWKRGESVDTEELRLCLQRYRDFFDRLVTR